MRQARITGIMPLTNTLELIDLKTGQMFYRRLKRHSVERLKLGQIYNIGDLK